MPGYDEWKQRVPSQFEDGEPAAGPVQKPGRSRQDYGTPIAFIEAVTFRFGQLRVDLAASAENAKAPDWITEAQDSLSCEWAGLYPAGNLWLNPPFANLDEWAEKCAKECVGRRGFILLLTPASIGTDWFENHVRGKAYVLGLSPRLTFEGEKDPYPKDLMLSVYGYGLTGFGTWRWRK